MLGKMTRAKICGITRVEDALLAEKLGAWALGFVFAPSKRQVVPEAVRPISLALGPLVVRVGVFQDHGPAEVIYAMRRASLQVAQLHGAEPPDWAEEIRKHFPVIKAFRLNRPAEPGWASYPADALLVDGSSPGSGKGYPLEWLGPLVGHPRLIISGGLGPEGLEAVLALKPYAVDVSSGVEASPGIKNEHKLRLFLERVRKLG